MSEQGLRSGAGEPITQYQEEQCADDSALKAGSLAGDRAYVAGDIIAERYRLERRLGEGGMGVVWVAHSLVLDVDVALKLIRSSVAGGGVASRMAREAHAAAKVAHPALVRVFDFGCTSHGDPFLVMELAQGETLDTVLAREVRLAAVRAVQILLPLADGLRCAHEKGVIHRDVKPENVFLAADPFGRVQPKLLDFGIAKTDRQAKDGRLTRAGAVLGSPEFMSPEQARGELDIDERTDVWSMCVMLYEMITGVLPFQKENYNALMQSILLDEPVPTHQLDAGDEALWQVLSRGLRKNLDERWTTMTELGEALALWLYERGVQEDVSGNSVRALWLDGTVSGVQWAPITTSPPDSDDPVIGEGAAGEGEREPASTQVRGQAVGAGARRGALARPYALAAAVGIFVGAGIALTLVVSFLRTEGSPQSSVGAIRPALAEQDLRPGRRAPSSPLATSDASTHAAATGASATPVSDAADHSGGAASARSASSPTARPQRRPSKRAPRRSDVPRTRVRDFGF